MENTTIFVAIRKETQMVMVGQKGQAAFTDKATLGRSIGYSHQHEARKKGVRASTLYSVHEIDVSMCLPRKEDVERTEVEPKFFVGQSVEICDNTCGHGFHIGSVVELERVRDKGEGRWDLFAEDRIFDEEDVIVIY